MSSLMKKIIVYTSYSYRFGHQTVNGDSKTHSKVIILSYAFFIKSIFLSYQCALCGTAVLNAALF